MSRDVVWSNEALSDFLGLFERIAQDNIQNAGRVADRIEHSVELLSRMQFGHAGRVFDTYEALVPKTPFIIVYRLVDANRLAIVRIIHTARSWPPGEWPTGD